MRLDSLKVSTRLALGFGLIISLLVIISTVGLLRVSELDKRLEHIVNVNMAKMEQLGDMSLAVHTFARTSLTLTLVDEPAQIAAQIKKIDAAKTSYASALAALQTFPATEAEQQLQQRLVALQKEAQPLVEQVAQNVESGSREIANLILTEKSIDATQRWQDALQEGISQQKEASKQDAASAAAAYQSALLSTLVLTAIALISAVIAGIAITRSLLRQLGGEPVDATRIAMQIAEGDLTVDIAVRDPGHQCLLTAMKQMRDSLLQLVEQVRAGTNTVTQASAEIASGSSELSARTESQAASLQETASSMEELTSTVQQNAENAQQASQLAASASEIAHKGGVAVAQVVETMGSINQSSRKIVDIIGVIDGIAFQTNILALNAAVEAARAGEQGRGFAVVAAEVRNLAQRSANAAKEIKTLIHESVSKVENGTRLVDGAGNTMNEVVQSVRRVTDIIAEIAQASAEQRHGIEQISHAVSEMDHVTQQNAALVEESSAAAMSLQQEAGNLARMVQVFKTGAASTHAAVKENDSAASSGKLHSISTGPGRKLARGQIAHGASA